MKIHNHWAGIFLLTTFVAFYAGNSTAKAGNNNEELAPEQQEFWERVADNCGKTFEGELADATPYYAQDLDPEYAAIHIRECTDELIHIAFHVNDDHSRNLMLSQTEGTLQLKHDHRYEDGTEEEISQYGGLAPSPGLPHRQIFEADDYTAEILPERFDNFWFLDFMDDETFAYGVHWPKHGHSIRFKFDISETVETPPDPWGY